MDNEYITVKQTVKIRPGCRNCLYCGSDEIRCANVHNRGRIMITVHCGRACAWYRLDGYRFQEVDESFYSV